MQCSDLFYFESQLRSDHFGSLDQLRDLAISYCKIRQLPPRTFVGLTRLRHLAIHTHNSDWTSLSLQVQFGRSRRLRKESFKIHYFQPDYEAFVGLDLLESLDLSDNNMQALPKGLLCPLVNLKTLNLSRNAIDSLQGLGLADQCGVVRDSLNLETLVLADAGLKTATPGNEP